MPREGGGGGGSAEGHEDRVVAADRAEDVVERGGVHGAGERLRPRRRSLDHHEIHRRLGGEDAVAYELIESLLAQVTPRGGGDGRDGGKVAGRDVAVRALGHAELVQVAGERRLRDAEAVLAQRGEQLVLRMDGV